MEGKAEAEAEVEGGRSECKGEGDGRTCSFALEGRKSFSPFSTHSEMASVRKALPSWVSRS